MREILRHNELARVANGLAQGQWYILYAPSGSGKTTFLCQLASHLQRSYRVKYLSLRACAGLNSTQVLNFLADALSPGAKVTTAVELRALLLATSGRLAILLDDVGALNPNVAGSLLNNFAAWRSESRLNPRLRNLGLILSSSKDLMALNNGLQSCLNTLEEYFLPDFSFAEVMSCAGEQAGEIWQLTEGHPWLTNYLHYQVQAGSRLVPYSTQGWLDNSVLNLTRLRLRPELLVGYSEGKWTGTVFTRELKLLGLAKGSTPELKVRNPLFRQILEEYIAATEIRNANYINNWKSHTPESLIRESFIPDSYIRGGQANYKTIQERFNGDELQLDTEHKEVWLKGKQVVLTPVEYRILEHLILNVSRIISKDQLAVAAYPGEPVPSTDVESHMKNLRRKLGDNAKNPRFIRCRRGFGYQAMGNACLTI